MPINWELYSEIRTKILTEPAAFNMNVLHATKGFVVKMLIKGEHAAVPSCGTVCCLWGWITTMCRPDRPCGYASLNSALEELGVQPTQENKDALFMATEGITNAMPGSQEYARAYVQYFDSKLIEIEDSEKLDNAPGGQHNQNAGRATTSNADRC